jgi:hypothetical protein
MTCESDIRELLGAVCDEIRRRIPVMDDEELLRFIGPQGPYEGEKRVSMIKDSLNIGFLVKDGELCLDPY